MSYAMAVHGLPFGFAGSLPVAASNRPGFNSTWADAVVSPATNTQITACGFKR